MCLNVTIQMRLKIKVTELESCLSATNIEKEPMDVEHVSQWFLDEFGIC